MKSSSFLVLSCVWWRFLPAAVPRGAPSRPPCVSPALGAPADAFSPRAPPAQPATTTTAAQILEWSAVESYIPRTTVQNNNTSGLVDRNNDLPYMMMTSFGKYMYKYKQLIFCLYILTSMK